MIQYIFLTLLILITYLSAFKKNKPTCNRYVQNVYLYLATAVSLLGIFVNILPTIMVRYFLYAVVLSFVSLILLFTRNPNVLLNHILWVVFILSISVILLPYKPYLLYSMVSTCIIFILMTFVATTFKSFFDTYTNFIGMGLFVSLVAIIITEIFLILTNMHNRSLFSYLVIILFSIFIAYDTNRLYYYAKTCVKSPNYPMQSTHLFLDIINILVRQ